MPKIINLEQQKQAMKEIMAGLRELNTINQFLNTESTSSVYSISFTDAAGKKYAANAYAAHKEELNHFVQAQRDRVSQHIRNLAFQYQIEFDEKDIMILENEPAPLEDIPEDYTEILVPVESYETQN